MDLEAFAAAGLYEPDSPGAAERRELLAFLVEQGCTIEEMVAAHARGRLFALAGDRVIRPGRDQLTLDEVAEHIDAPPDTVRALWRAFGLVEADPGSAVASPDDVAVLRTALFLVDVLGLPPVLGLARVMGSSLARLGDALGTTSAATCPTCR